MSAAAILNTARRAGIRLTLKFDGAVRAEPTPPPELLAELRANKDLIAAVLATSTHSPDLPVCRRCQGQRFWRTTTDGIVGDWTCAQSQIHLPDGIIDILGPLRSAPAIVHCCTRDDVEDADAFAEMLFRWGQYIALGRVRARQC